LDRKIQWKCKEGPFRVCLPRKKRFVLHHHCNVLQNAAHTATHCNTLLKEFCSGNIKKVDFIRKGEGVSFSTSLQHAAKRCNKLQHTATHCRTSSELESSPHIAMYTTISRGVPRCGCTHPHTHIVYVCVDLCRVYVCSYIHPHLYTVRTISTIYPHKIYRILTCDNMTRILKKKDFLREEERLLFLLMRDSLC